MKQAATLFIPLLVIVPGLALTGFTLTSGEAKDPHAPIIAATPLPYEKPIDLKGHIPAESLYQIMAAEMALDREQPEIALANYIAAAKETQDAGIAARATQIALSVSSLETAVEPSTIWAKAAPNNLEAQITTAALYIRLDQVAKALPFLHHAEQTNPDEAFQYFLILFRQLQKEEDNKRVLQALHALAKEETKVASGHLALAEIYLYQGQDAKSLEMSQEALKIDPHSVIGSQLVTEALLHSKGKAIAKTFLDKKIQEVPHEVTLHQYYAQFLLENGYHEQAKKQIEHLINNPKVSTEELLQFARLAMQAQWFDLAEKILKRTKEVPASKDLSHYFLARIAEMQDKDAVAIEWFKQVLTGPFHVLSQVRASVLLADKKQYDEALEILSHAQPTDFNEKKQLVLSTVDVYNRAKRYKDSLALLNDSINSMPEEIDFLYARSLVADHIDRLDIAEGDLKAILASQPNHLDALNALGYMLANKTKRYDEAQQYLSEALKLSPNNASVLDSIGWLYYKKGDYKKSLETLRKASEIMPDGEIAAHLGEVMWQMKDYDGAKKVWSQALEHHPKHENLMNVMQRLMSNKEGQSVQK
jgi:tetratricopeptide (TPR) repeat protein